jgi:tRNA-Thr(GGU) m(6)t(6)A37 methyltransferase TsaA
MPLKLRPIGYVRTSASHETLRHGSGVSKIIIDPKFAKGLEGLEGFSHAYILFWLHNATKWGDRLKVHPRGCVDIEKVGVFATRSPHRPNPIGLTLVRLLSKRGRTLIVKGLDAYDGTPVLDIKPHDERDSAPRPQVPRWWKKLKRESKHTRQIKRG